MTIPRLPHASLLGLAWLLANVAFAQTSDALTKPKAMPPEETIELSPFEVRASDVDGYVANSSLSATRLATNIKDLPFNVQIVTEDMLRDLGRDSIEESLTQVSNVSVGERNRDAGPDSALIGLRGFKSNVILRNGVKGFYPDSMVDVERVEVIKGPTALYGVSDPGGVVNYMTKVPVPRPHVRLQAQTGSYERRGVTLDVNQPLTKNNRVLFRLISNYEYYEDIQPFVNFERSVFEPMLTIKPTRTTTMHASYSYTKRTGIPIRNPSPFQVTATGKNYQTGFVDVSREFTTTNPTDVFSRNTQNLETWVEQRLGANWTFRASYSQMDFDSEFYGTWTGNADRTAAAPYYLQRTAVVEFHEADLDSLTVNLTGKLSIGPTRHTFLIGAQSDNQNRLDWNKQIRPSDPLGLPKVNITNPNPDPAIQYSNLTRAQILSGAGIIGGTAGWRTFGSKTYFLTDEIRTFHDKLILLAALRRTEVDSPVTKKTSPQLGMTWHTTDQFTVYAGYSEALQPNSGTDSNGDPFAPENGQAWEVGVKLDFGNKLSGTLAAFHIARENILVTDGSASQYNAIHPTEPPRPIRYLGGTQESDGFEADLIYTPLPNWQNVISYGYNDARTTESPLQSLPTDPAADASGLVDIVGLANEGSAKNNFGVWTRYKFTQGALKGLAIGGGGYWRQGPIQLFPTFQNRFVRQEEDIYELNFFANYSTTKLFGKSTTFGLNVTNVTDEVFWVSRGLYVQPRKFLLSMSVNF